MEVDLKLKLPIKSVFASLENALIKQIQITDSQDIEMLKELILGFQRKVWKQIEYFSSASGPKVSATAQSEKDLAQINVNNNNINNSNNNINNISNNNNVASVNQGSLMRNGKEIIHYNTRKQSKGQRKSESDSEYEKSSSKTVQSENENSDHQNSFYGKYNILTPQDRKYIKEYFKKHFNPTKRNKMQIVKTCQSKINSSFNSIYAMITHLIKKEKAKGRLTDSMPKTNPRKESSDEMDEEFINNFNINDIHNQNEEVDDMIDDDSINDLLSKYQNGHSESKHSSNFLSQKEDDYQDNNELKGRYRDSQMYSQKQELSNKSVRIHPSNGPLLEQKLYVKSEDLNVKNQGILQSYSNNNNSIHLSNEENNNLSQYDRKPF